MFSHWSFETTPTVQVSQEISVKDCLEIHATRKLQWNGRKHAVRIGSNDIAVTSSGNLQYDAKSGTVSCLGENARRTPDSEQMVTETLVFEHLNLVLSKEQGKQLVEGEQTLVILSGPDHGVELTRGEVIRGGVTLGSVTYVLDPLEPKIQEQCPMSVLREKLTLMRTTKEGQQENTEWFDPAKVNWKNSSISPRAVIWQNSEVAIHLKKKRHLPSQCQAAAGSVFYETNHESILVSPDAEPKFIDQIRSNPLDYLTMINLAEESRSDLVHNHVDGLLRNLSSQIEEIDCRNQFQQLLLNVEEEQDSNQKKRMIRSGEVLFQLVCSKVELRPGPVLPTSLPICTQALPVRLATAQSSLGTTDQPLFLEANTRYLTFSSKKVPCAVQQLAPAVYETQAGNHIYWNGTQVQYLKQEVLEAQLLKKKYRDLEQYDLNLDLDSSGIETEDQIQTGSLYAEYQQFVEIDRREDLAGSPPDWKQMQATSSGRRAHGWYMGAKAGVSELSSTALDIVGLGWTTKVVKGMEEFVEWITPLAHIGGASYALCLIWSILTKTARFAVLAYTLPGTKMTQLLSLAMSGQTRTRHDLSQEMEALVKRKVSENIQTELAVARAERRQEEGQA
jgi:hypothetical protein